MGECVVSLKRRLLQTDYSRMWRGFATLALSTNNGNDAIPRGKRVRGRSSAMFAASRRGRHLDDRHRCGRCDFEALSDGNPGCVLITS